MILNKFNDMFKKFGPNLFKKWRKEALIIKEIKCLWLEKMKAPERKEYNEKDINESHMEKLQKELKTRICKDRILANFDTQLIKVFSTSLETGV